MFTLGNYHLSAYLAITQLYHLLYPNIPVVKITLKTGTSGEISRVFKAHFHPLKDYET